MSDEQTAAAVESALESAFGGLAPELPKPQAQAPEAPPPAAEEPRDPAQDLLDAAEPPTEESDKAAEPEPEFAIEVNGQTEVVRGAEQIRELLQKGMHFSRGSEEVARVREQLVAQQQFLATQQKFQQEIVGDIAELRALDTQLAQFNGVNWSQLIDADFSQALKLQEQRNVLRDARAAKLNDINGKQQQFEKGLTQAALQLQAAEEAALIAKLPEWRNSERAAIEKQATAKLLLRSGYQPGEIANPQIVDHRLVLLARDAMKWQELQRTSREKAKQVRDAPPVIKPGAAPAQADANSKAGFDKFTREFRKQGRAGNHKAQETALEKVLSRTFR